MPNNKNFTLEDFIVISTLAIIIFVLFRVILCVCSFVYNLVFGGNDQIYAYEPMSYDYRRNKPIGVGYGGRERATGVSIGGSAVWDPTSPDCDDGYFVRAPNGLLYAGFYDASSINGSHDRTWISDFIPERAGIDPKKIPMAPIINNLDALLHDIYVRFVAIQQDDFTRYYHVFGVLFEQMQDKMKEVDPYYRKYSSRKQFAGSHFDNLRINKPDEFDMDIVISLPIDFDTNNADPAHSDIVFEPKHAAYTHLRMGKQFQMLPYRDQSDWEVNKTAFKWKDDKDYLLCDKFVAWFKGVVVKALNSMGDRIRIHGAEYKISRSESGPAITITVSNANGFRLDVDFVPALKFPESRWPISRAYRKITPDCSTGDWMCVPKPNRDAPISQEKNRCWRIANHNQEKKIIHSCNNLKQTIRLMKKLRDSLEMHSIASYYVKTLFLWEMEKQSRNFWNSPLSTLFKHMVGRLRDAIVCGKIPYYWNKDNNLIAGVSPATLTQYKSKLDKLIVVLGDNSRYKEVAKYLLKGEDYVRYSMDILKI